MTPPVLAISTEDASASSAELEPIALGLLAELEQSLIASQKALLARDLSAIERGTEEQRRLLRAFGIAGAPRPNPARRRDSEGVFKPRLSLSPRLIAAHRRVWQLARVQRALLARAQQSNRMLTRLLAGPQACYGAFLGREAMPAVPAFPSQIKAES